MGDCLWIGWVADCIVRLLPMFFFGCAREFPAVVWERVFGDGIVYGLVVFEFRFSFPVTLMATVCSLKGLDLGFSSLRL